MNTWLIFIKSEGQFQKMRDFLKHNGNKIYSPLYYVINGPLKCKNNRIIGAEGEVLLALSFIAYNKTPIKTLLNKKIANPNDIIQLNVLDDNEVILEDDLESDCYIKKGKNFFNKKTLLSYLEKIEFKFKV